MEMKQVSDHCFTVLSEKNRVCDANSGLVNLGGGVVIDTQSDLPHARRMIELFGRVWTTMPRRVVNTHEDADHVWGNQLFQGAEIIAHRSVPDRMREVADPKESQNVERAYRELRNEPADAPWDTPATFDAIYEVAAAKGIPIEF